MEENRMQAADYFAQARSCRGQGNLDEAERLCRAGLALSPASYEMYVALGEICANKNEYEKALAAYGEALEHFPDNAVLYHEIGRLYSRNKEYRQAVGALERARELGVEDRAIDLDIGYACREMGEYGKSIAAMDRAIERDPDDWNAYFLKGETMACMGDDDGAEQAFEKALSRAPGSKPVQIQMKILCGRKVGRLVASGKVDEAIAAYRRAIVCCPGEAQLRLELGKLLVSKGNYAAAIGEFDAGIQATPDNWDLWYEKGKTMSHIGDDDGAEKEFEKVLSQVPGNTKAQAQMAILCGRKIDRLLASGKVDGAIAAYRRAIACCPGEAQLRLGLGKLLVSQGDYAQAIGEFDAGIKAAPDNGEFCYEKGEALVHMGDDDGAGKEFERVLSLAPGNTKAQAQMAILCGRKAGRLLASGNVDEAIALFRRTIACCPEETQLRLELGKLLVSKGDYAAAVSEFDVGVERNPDSWVFRYERGMCYLHLGQRDKVIADFEYIMQLQPEHYRQVLKLGAAYVRIGEYDKAAAALNAAVDIIEKQPDEANANDEEVRNYRAMVSGRECHDDARKKFISKKINNEESCRVAECVSKPSSLFFFLTHRCNLQCIMCERVRRDQVTLPLQVFDKLQDWIPCAERINWQGGEAFLVDYFKDLLVKTCEAHPYIVQNITTNGLLITGEWAKLLAQYNVWMHFSIDSVEQHTYEQIRKGGSFSALMRNLETMQNEYAKRYAHNGYVFTMNVLVMKHNCDELTRMPAFCRKYGFRALRFNYLSPELVPDQDLFRDGNRDTVERLQRAITEVEARCREFGIQFECFVKPLLPVREEKHEAVAAPAPVGAEKQLFRCLRPWTNLIFYADGTVLPACECPVVVGNIVSDSMESIWNGDRMKSYRRHIMEGTAPAICSWQCLKGLTSGAGDGQSEKFGIN